MKPSSEYDERDREIIELLKALGDFKSSYPSELLAARRAAFLAQVKRLSPEGAGEELSAEDQEIINLLGNLKSAQAEYPPQLLAARRAALIDQMERTERISVLDNFRVYLQRIFPSGTIIPTVMRISLVVASLILAVLMRPLFLPRTQQSLLPSSSEAAASPTYPPSTGNGETAITVCRPDDQTALCPSGDLDPSPDLADAGNGAARPAVSNDARSSQNGVHTAAYVNDGQSGASWVSTSMDSWIKIDLGKVTTINTVSLQKGSTGASNENSLGQFVIAVALSDVYMDGDSNNDYVEYAQVFRSEQTSFNGTVSEVETIKTQFSPVRARFVKITFEQEGAAIEEVGVFMVQPPALSEQQPTGSPSEAPAGTTVTPPHTNTASPVDTAVSLPTATPLPPSTVASIPTDTPTRLPTFAPVDTATPVPTYPLPTPVPPTAIPPTIQIPPASSDPIMVTGTDQTLTFTCNGNAAEIRGQGNTITLLGSCSSITVTGNGNIVFWESGSPVITNNGRDNIIRQL
jgi:hypothetical protein